MKLPDIKDTLFVTKPIDRYEPLRSKKQDGQLVVSFNPDPNQVVKKKFHSQPQTHSEIRDINIELTSEMLQKIQAAPVKIDFGSIYVNSKMTKTFYIRSDLRTALGARLHTDRPEFQHSTLKTQIIPSGQIAGFDVTVCSSTLGPIK